jgi:hypothetical protein
LSDDVVLNRLGEANCNKKRIECKEKSPISGGVATT